jgi:glutathione synthase/RimK-type ligase-like ATP-grasp enzyme
VSAHVIVVDDKGDLEWAASAGTAMTARDFVTQPERLQGKKLRVVNLSGEYDYLDFGYYTSLLAEARGYKVVPSVASITLLARKMLYAPELPELNAVLRKDIERMTDKPRAAFTLTLCFGKPTDARFATFGRAVFDRFRCPLLSVEIEFDERWSVRALEPLAPRDLSPAEFDEFLHALEAYTRSGWETPKQKSPPRYSLAILHNPGEQLPPSDADALKKFITTGLALGVEVELIERKDYLRLAEYDALFIRETTSVGDHTYRFAKKAEREGLVVIDDPTSIIRCTNKVYLAEVLAANKLPAPRTLILDRNNLADAERTLAYPIVLKIPDSSFSRGIVKVENTQQLMEHGRKLLQKSDVIIAQEFMFTEYDWRVGVLNRQPLFACQYRMAPRHWQIVRHKQDGKAVQGGCKTFAVADAPAIVVETAVKAANLMGDGLYGVDLKQNERGVFVIEVNDNPNLDRGVEDAVLKDELYSIVIKDFIRRIEAR